MSKNQLRTTITPWVIGIAVIIVGALIYGYVKTNTPASEASTGSIYRYVATDGNDTSGDGSFAKPYRTIRKAITTTVSTTRSNIYIYPKGTLQLHRDDTTTNPINLPPRSNVIITGQPVFNTLAGGRNAKITAGGFSSNPLVLSVNSATLNVTFIDWDRVNLRPTLGKNSSFLFSNNKVESIIAPGQLPGDVLVRTQDATAKAIIRKNTFVLADLKADCCRVKGLDLMHSQNGSVTITQNRFVYPKIDNRLGPKLKYQGISLWSNAADGGSGISISDNTFTHLGYLPQPQPLATDVGIYLAGAKNVKVGSNDFTKFLGIPVQP